DAGGNRYRVKIWSAAADGAGTWQLHATGELEVTEAGEAPLAVDAARVHARFAELGVRQIARGRARRLPRAGPRRRRRARPRAIRRARSAARHRGVLRAL